MDFSDAVLPELDQPYDDALEQAVQWICRTHDVLGIIACGSIIRGNPGPSSDFDIVAINAKPIRQRVQRRFNGVPTEIFLNPPAAIRAYFLDENHSARPCTAHMISYGFVVANDDEVVDRLIEEANEWLARAPAVIAFQKEMTRYGAIDLLDNAADLLATARSNDRERVDFINAEHLIHLAISRMLHWLYLAQDRNLPREKELFQSVNDLDPIAGAKLRACYAAGNAQERLARAKTLADHLLGVHEFYAWESQPERFPLEA